MTRRLPRNQNRVAVFPYGPSNSLNEFMPLFTEALPGRSVRRLRREGSAFRARPDDVVINWGSSSIPAPVLGNARVLNRPEAVALASHKLRAFQRFEQHDVETVEFTNNRSVAQQWMDNGDIVFARTRVSGHSGEGIVVCTREGFIPEGMGTYTPSHELVTATLYTKGFTQQRREFRIHVAGGVISHVQQKKRADGWRDNPNYSNIVRNYHTGWIYSIADVQVNNAARDNALLAVGALGLDFGAVDVITRGNEAWVLEVNTAPGLSGTNMEHYVRNLTALVNGAPVSENQPSRVAIDTSEQAADDGFALEEAPVADRRAPTAPTARAEVTRFDPQDTPTAQPAAAAPAVPETPAPAPARPRGRVTYINGAFYRATMRGVATVVQYNADIDSFFAPGWEIPLTQGIAEHQIVVGARLEV